MELARHGGKVEGHISLTRRESNANVRDSEDDISHLECHLANPPHVLLSRLRRQIHGVNHHPFLVRLTRGSWAVSRHEFVDVSHTGTIIRLPVLFDGVSKKRFRLLLKHHHVPEKLREWREGLPFRHIVEIRDMHHVHDSCNIRNVPPLVHQSSEPRQSPVNELVSPANHLPVAPAERAHIAPPINLQKHLEKEDRPLKGHLIEIHPRR